MDEGAVGTALDALAAARVRYWVEGGWGVDALVGHRTRDHDDLDLAVDAGDGGFDRAVTALADLGYRRGLDDLPVRLVVEHADGGRLDLHPLHFGSDGAGVQQGHTREYVYPADGFTTGRIGDRSIACLTARLQRDFHSGYPPRPVDHHDLAQLDAVAGDPAS